MAPSIEKYYTSVQVYTYRLLKLQMENVLGRELTAEEKISLVNRVLYGHTKH